MLFIGTYNRFFYNIKYVFIIIGTLVFLDSGEDIILLNSTINET